MQQVARHAADAVAAGPGAPPHTKLRRIHIEQVERARRPDASSSGVPGIVDNILPGLALFRLARWPPKELDRRVESRSLPAVPGRAANDFDTENDAAALQPLLAGLRASPLGARPAARDC
jgi:hypothetical protein